jgi:hypothetical protein
MGAAVINTHTREGLVHTFCTWEQLTESYHPKTKTHTPLASSCPDNLKQSHPRALHCLHCKKSEGNFGDDLWLGRRASG